MIKSIVVHDIPISHIAAMERWYYKAHAPEINRRFGSWLTRHDSYLPVDAPSDARAFGFYNWRVTEGWWRDIPKAGPGGNLAFSVPPVWPKVATCFIPAQPTEDFMGYEYQPWEKQVLRWFILFKYPKNVSLDEGEDWFLQVHAKEVMHQPGLYRFFSYQTLREPIPLPGAWAPGKRPPADTVLSSWDRLIELWYETFDDWRNAVIQAPPHYTRPTWATTDHYPFVEPGKDFVSSFILERPNDEFWRDSRGYL